VPNERLSIVTISFNQARFLEECLRSVIGQKEPWLEYIVVDPGSADGSRGIIQRHAAAIDDVILEPDAGPADGLNRGFARATGEIFGYLNADDRFVPGALAFARDWFRAHPDADVLCGAVRIVDTEGRASLRRRTPDRFDPVRYASGICTIGQQATFFRRRAFEAAGGFNTENRVTWDGELLVDMALAGARFETVNKVLGDFRVYRGTISGSAESRARQRRELQRVRGKIAIRYPLHSPRERMLRRLLYKLDLLRHLRYLLAR
jgi:glycosyltransferase involved in cell wall biosynthesis